MVIKEDNRRSDPTDIDFQYIAKGIDFIKSRSNRSYRNQKPLTVAETSNIEAYMNYIEKVIDILWEASKV